MPRSSAARWAAIILLAVSESGAALETAGTEGGTLADGRGISTSACTDLGLQLITTVASTSEETPASSQIRSGAFRPGEPDLRRITICLCY